MDFRDQGPSPRAFIIHAIACVLLQAGVAPQIEIAGGRINFMIILVALCAFSGDPSRAVWCGFLSGLFYDLTASVPVGVMSLLLTVGSFALVHGNWGLTAASATGRGLVIGVFALAVNAVYSIILLFMGLETNVFIALFGHALPSAILTGIVAIPVLALTGFGASASGFSARGSGQGGMRFKPKTRGLK